MAVITGVLAALQDQQAFPGADGGSYSLRRPKLGRSYSNMAARAGVEPALSRVTVERLTTWLPCKMVPETGIEPVPCRVSTGRSTPELFWVVVEAERVELPTPVGTRFTTKLLYL